MEKEKKSYSAPALDKGLDIIELLSTQEDGLSKSDIARALNRTVGEIYRMLTVLEARGYVAQESLSDKYVLTTFLFEISNRIPKVKRLTTIAGPLMKELSKRINQSSHLAILSEDSVLVIVQTDSPGNNNLSVRLGAKISLWRASSGLVLLAYASSEIVDKYMKTVPLPEATTQDEIQVELEKILKNEMDVRDSFVVRGVTNISAPVFDHSGEVIAALTVPHINKIADKTSFEECKENLKATAQALSKSLGFAPQA